jgi:hypothetical protein
MEKLKRVTNLSEGIFHCNVACTFSGVFANIFGRVGILALVVSETNIDEMGDGGRPAKVDAVRRWLWELRHVARSVGNCCKEAGNCFN